MGVSNPKDWWMRRVMPMMLEEATPEPPIMSVLVASEN